MNGVGCNVNRYKLHEPKPIMPKEFYLRPGDHWFINSLGLDQNFRMRGLKFPPSLKVVTYDPTNFFRQIKFRDDRSEGFISKDDLLKFYDSMEQP